MAHPRKLEIVSELKEKIDSSTITVMTRYKGITVEQVTRLRSLLRAENVTFKVYKNTLAKRALDDLGLSEAVDFMEGPTVWAFCEDPVAPARILKTFSKEVSNIGMQGGIFEGAPITGEQLNTMADLPSREQLLAQVVGTIAMPLRNLVGTLSAVPRNFVNVLDQIRKQKEESEAA